MSKLWSGIVLVVALALALAPTPGASPLGKSAVKAYNVPPERSRNGRTDGRSKSLLSSGWC